MDFVFSILASALKALICKPMKLFQCDYLTSMLDFPISVSSSVKVISSIYLGFYVTYITFSSNLLRGQLYWHDDKCESEDWEMAVCTWKSRLPSQSAMWRSVLKRLQSRLLLRPLLPADGESWTSSLWLSDRDQGQQNLWVAHDLCRSPSSDINTERGDKGENNKESKDAIPYPLCCTCSFLIPRKEKQL